ncbi:hypothetical protein BLOT_008574 [Blomia tropicalis]|nr:hypothetical protein BLOT_008574 [Blomia tropicalis]
MPYHCYIRKSQFSIWDLAQVFRPVLSDKVHRPKLQNIKLVITNTKFDSWNLPEPIKANAMMKTRAMNRKK